MQVDALFLQCMIKYNQEERKEIMTFFRIYDYNSKSYPIRFAARENGCVEIGGEASYVEVELRVPKLVLCGQEVYANDVIAQIDPAGKTEFINQRKICFNTVRMAFTAVDSDGNEELLCDFLENHPGPSFRVVANARDSKFKVGRLLFLLDQYTAGSSFDCKDHRHYTVQSVWGNGDYAPMVRIESRPINGKTDDCKLWFITAEEFEKLVLDQL